MTDEESKDLLPEEEYLNSLPEEERFATLKEIETLNEKLEELVSFAAELGYNCFTIMNKMETPLMGTIGTIDSYTVYQTFKVLMELDEAAFAEFIKDVHASRSKIIIPDEETTH